MKRTIATSAAKRAARSGVIAGSIVAALAVGNLMSGGEEILVGLLLAFPAVALLAVYAPRLASPERFPAFAGDIHLLGNVDEDLAAAGPIKVGWGARVFVGSCYLLQSGLLGVGLLQLSSLRRVYAKRTTHTYLRIPLAREWSVVLVESHDHHEIPCRKAEADRVLAAIALAVPNVLLGTPNPVA